MVCIEQYCLKQKDCKNVALSNVYSLDFIEYNSDDNNNYFNGDLLMFALLICFIILLLTGTILVIVVCIKRKRIQKQRKNHIPFYKGLTFNQEKENNDIELKPLSKNNKQISQNIINEKNKQISQNIINENNKQFGKTDNVLKKDPIQIIGFDSKLNKIITKKSYNMYYNQNKLYFLKNEIGPILFFISFIKPFSNNEYEIKFENNVYIVFYNNNIILKFSKVYKDNIINNIIFTLLDKTFNIKKIKYEDKKIYQVLKNDKIIFNIISEEHFEITNKNFKFLNNNLIKIEDNGKKTIILNLK